MSDSSQPATMIAKGSQTGLEELEVDPLTMDLVGTVLSNRYRVLKKLGEGGMGSVYLAEHTTINKKLAIKVLSSEFSNKQDLVDRFLQEARAASMIDQQNVVEITDFGSNPNEPVYFVMEFLNGEDLSGTIRNCGPLPWGRVKPIMLQICSALDAAHAAGIIHRDMKPENCYRIQRGGNADFIKVLDFGIAKVTSDEGEGKNLTRTGMIFGTPEYMSPEQAKGERVDHRVDIYATGVILYELLTGQVPFTADTFMGILTKHMFEAPPAPSSIVGSDAVPHEVEAIVLKALQKDREYRFQSMQEMAEAINAVGTGTGAVSVVVEDIATPSIGQTTFANSGQGDPATKRGPWLMVGVAAIVMATATGGAFAAGLFSPSTNPVIEPDQQVAALQPDMPIVEPKPEDPPPVATKPDPAPDPAIDPVAEPLDSSSEKPVEPVPPSEVDILIETPGIRATVIDTQTDTKLGMTNTPMTLPFGHTYRVLIRARGYDSQTIDFTADEEQTRQVSLKRKRQRRPSGSNKPAQTPSTNKPVEPATPKPAVEKPVKPKPNTTSVTPPDLKDPFN